MDRKISFILLLAASAACSPAPLTNNGKRVGQIHELTSFGLSTTTPVVAPGYWIAGDAGAAGVEFKFLDLVFVHDRTLWTLAQWSVREPVFTRYLEVSRMDNGMRTIVRTVETPAFDSQCNSISDIAMHAGGKAWLVCYDSQELVEVEVETLTILRRLPAPSRSRSIVVFGDHAFVGTGSDVDHPLEYDVFEIDLANGSVIRSLGADVRAKIGDVENTHVDDLAITGNRLLVRTAFESAEALLFDPVSADFVGFATGGPLSNLTSDPVHPEGSFFGLDYDYNGGAIPYREYSLAQDPIRAPAITSNLLFAFPGARAVTWADGELWVLFAGPQIALVAYDPTTLMPIDGFTVPPEVVSSHQLDGGNQLTGFAVHGTSIYLSAHTFEQLLYPKGSTLLIFDFATGQFQQALALDVPIRGMCSTSDGLFGIAESDPMMSSLPHRPQLLQLDPANGGALRELPLPLDIVGKSRLLCGTDAVAVAGDASRTFGVTTTAATPATLDPFAFGLMSAGTNGVEADGSLWMIDRASNQLLRVEAGIAP